MALEPNADWFRDAVFYEVIVRSMADSDGDGKGDFKGLTSKLDYIRDLGVDCIWVTPMYPSPLHDDGYDIADFTGVHPDLGSIEDITEFIAAAHDRGMRVVADLVMNHCSADHPWFQEARHDRNSPKRDYFVWSDDNSRYGDTRIIFLDTEPSNWTWDEVAGQYYWHRFFWHQPDLNYDNPAVWEEMFKVARFWLDLGLDGFRCDAVPYLYERDGTNCENLPETHGFLRKLRKMVDTEYPGRILLAEANQWPEDVIEYFGTTEEPEFQMGFHFPVMPRLYMAVRKHDRSSIVEILERTPALPTGCQWATFLRNHDELTLEMVTVEDREYMWAEYAPDPRMRSNLGIRRRLAPLMDNDRKRIELMNALVLSLPGSPCLYYGDEIGMGDNIWLPDRNGVRTPMQWNESAHAGFTDGEETWIPLIEEGEFDYHHVNVEAQQGDPGSLLNWVSSVLAIRSAHRCFGRGEFCFRLPDDQRVLGYLRAWEGEHVLCIANLSPDQVTTALLLDDFAGVRPHDLLTGKILPEVGTGGYQLELEPWAYHWLKIDRGR